MLLGFEHLSGAHTGANLSTVFLDTLQECGIAGDRVLTITSDNASNNKTLTKQVEIAMRLLDDKIGRVLRVPCLSHIIQLALKDLVMHIKIKPQNSTFITEWHEDEAKRAKHTDARKNDGVPWTLKKVR